MNLQSPWTIFIYSVNYYFITIPSHSIDISSHVVPYIIIYIYNYSIAILSHIIRYCWVFFFKSYILAGLVIQVILVSFRTYLSAYKISLYTGIVFSCSLPMARVKALEVEKKWHRAFHGTRVSALEGILKVGELVKPGV